MRTLGTFLALCCISAMLAIHAVNAETISLACTPSKFFVMTDKDNIYRFQLGQSFNYHVLEWAPIAGTPEMMGRYRLSLRAISENLLPGKLLLQAIPVATPQFPSAVTQMGGQAFAAQNEWQTFTLDFDVELGKPVIPCLVNNEYALAKDGAVQIDKTSIKIEKLACPLSIAWARTAKIRYKHNERGELQAHLSNTTMSAQRVSLTPIVIDDGNVRLPGKAISVIIPARQTIAVSAPFPIGKADGGFEVVADLTQKGKLIEERSGDVFAVSDDPWQCSIFLVTGMTAVGPEAYPLGYKGMAELTQNKEKWEAYTHEIGDCVERMRRSYATAYEYFAWAHEDACWLVEDTDEPYLTGQTTYAASRKLIKYVNGLLRNDGIAPVAYVNGCAFGWPAFEFLRQHPEWLDERYGSGAYNTESIEKYQRKETVAAVNPGLPFAFDQPSPVDGKTFLAYHIDQLTRSAKYYGWEAYRYDAGPLDLEHFPPVKNALARLSPAVGIGNNMAGAGFTMADAEGRKFWDIYSNHGSMMMDEPLASGFQNILTDPRHKWVDWIDYLRLNSNCTRANGGHYCADIIGANWLAFPMSYAVGGHPYTMPAKSPYGDYERFMLHYGYIFWDLRTQMLPAPEKILEVTTAHPIWWKQFVSRRVLGNGHRQIIVPLINKAVEEATHGVTLPGPVEQAIVTFTPAAGENVTAVLLAPEPTAQRSELPITTTPDGRIQVTVPKFYGWSNVVFDCWAR